MKKTLSMLLALLLMVGIVAIPATAETVGLTNKFDISSYEVGTVLSAETLGEGSAVMYAGVGTTADIQCNYQGADTTLATKNYIRITDATSTEEGSQVVVAELEGEKFTDIVAPAYTDKALLGNMSFEDMAIGARPSGSETDINVGAGNAALPYASNMTDTFYSEVVYNPATGLGNPSGKVLAVMDTNTTSEGLTLVGFRTNAFPAADVKAPGGVTVQFDAYTPSVFINGRMLFYTAHPVTSQWPNLSKTTFAGSTDQISYMHVVNTKGGFTFGGQQSGGSIVWNTNGSASSSRWVRFFVNYKLDVNNNLTVTMSNQDLTTNEITQMGVFNYDKRMSSSDNYGFAISFSAEQSAAYYFDNIKVVSSTLADVTTVYSETSDYSVIADGSAIKVDIPAPIYDVYNSNVKLYDSSDAEVTATVSQEVVNGKTTLTITPEVALNPGEVYYVDLSADADVYGNYGGIVKFMAVEDWMAYDPANPETVVSELEGDVALNESGSVYIENADGPVDMANYTVTSSDSSVVEIAEGDGVYTATAIGDGTAYITVKSLTSSGVPATVYEINVVGITTTYTVTFVDGDTITEAVVGEGWAVEAPKTNPGEGQLFFGWVTEENGSEYADLASVRENMTVYAAYRDPITVSFAVSDENLGSIANPDVIVPAGSSISAIPEITSDGYIKVVKYVDEAGNEYTEAELLARTFNENATITVVIARTKLEMGKVYDFTAMTAEDLICSPFTFDNNEVTVDENGLTITGVDNIYATVGDEISSGVYKLDMDVVVPKTTATGINGDFYNNNGSYIQGLFVTDSPIYSRAVTDDVDVPRAFANLSNDGTETKISVIFDFDNKGYYVIKDGVIGVISDTSLMGQVLRGTGALKRFKLYATSGVQFKSIAMTQLSALDLRTLEVSANEGTVNIGGNASITSYTFPAEAKVGIGYTGDTVKYNFNGWTVEGGKVEDATAASTMFSFGAAGNATAVANDEIRMVTHKFVETDVVTFTEETKQYAEQTVAATTTLAGVPELVVADGYEFIGWCIQKEDGTVGSENLTSDLIATTPVDGDYTWYPNVKKFITTNVSLSSAQAQKGETVEVPFKVSSTEAVTGGTVTFTYDPEVLSYVGSEIANEFKTTGYVKKVADGELQLIINTDKAVDISTAKGVLKFKTLAETTEVGTEISATTAFEYDVNVITEVNESVVKGGVLVSALKGDINADGKINIYDAAAVLKHIASIEILEDTALAVADVDGTEGVSIGDATTILKYIARLISKF